MATQTTARPGQPGAPEAPAGAGARVPARPAGRGGRRLWAALALGVALLALAPAGARGDDYEPKRAGHPLRIVAYVLHPVGVMLDYLLMRPSHWVVHHEPFKTLFGHTDDDD